MWGREQLTARRLLHLTSAFRLRLQRAVRDQPVKDFVSVKVEKLQMSSAH